MEYNLKFIIEKRKICFNDIPDIEQWLKNNNINKIITIARPGIEEFKCTLFEIAIEDGDLEVVKYLTENGADIHSYSDDFWNTAIEIAASYGQLEILKYLISKFDRKEFLNDNSIVYAAQGNYPEIIKYLFTQGKDINMLIDSKYTALIEAVEAENIESVKVLCELGAKVDIICDGETPLYVAATNNNIEIVKILLKFGANVNYITEDGSTAYEAAIYNGYNDLAKYLLENGADPNLAFIKRGGRIPSAWFAHISKEDAYEAAKSENCGKEPTLCDDENCMNKSRYKDFKREKVDIVSKWLDDNNMPLPDDKYKNTWFEYAVLNDSTTETIKFLLSLGISPYTSSSYEWNTIIEFAAMYGRLDIIKFLLENGYDHEVFLKDNSLIFAASNDFTNIIKYLIEKGKDINQSFGEEIGYTALREAAYLGNTESVELLCKLGADVNILNKYDTPLYSASAEGNLETVKILVNYGADINKANSCGITPYEVSTKFGQKQVAEYLLSHGAKN